MNRKSYIQLHQEYVARVRSASPELAALLSESDHADEQFQRDLALEETCQRLYGKVPESQADVYAAEQSLDSRQVLKGRGED